MPGQKILSCKFLSRAPSRVLWGVEKVMVAEIGTNKKPLSCVEPLERKGIKGEILANAILHKLGHPVQRTDGFIKFNGDICAAGKGAGVFAGFSPSWRPAPLNVILLAVEWFTICIIGALAALKLDNDWFNEHYEIREKRREVEH